MKIELISEKFKTHLKVEILNVLCGRSDILKVDSLHPSFVIDFLKEIGIDIDLGDDMDTNGWQWDYWIKFRYNEKPYILSGSGYYGNLELKVDTDAENEEKEENEAENLESEIKEGQLIECINELLTKVNKFLEIE